MVTLKTNFIFMYVTWGNLIVGTGSLGLKACGLLKCHLFLWFCFCQLKIFFSLFLCVFFLLLLVYLLKPNNRILSADIFAVWFNLNLNPKLFYYYNFFI